MKLLELLLVLHAPDELHARRGGGGRCRLLRLVHHAGPVPGAAVDRGHPVQADMKKYAFLPGACHDRRGRGLGGPDPAVGRAGARARRRRPAGARAWAWPPTRQAIREWFADPRGIFALNSHRVHDAAGGDPRPGERRGRASRHHLRLDRGGPQHADRRHASHPAGASSKDVRVVQYGRAHDPLIDGKLAAFAAVSPRIRTEFVDIDAAPQAVKQYAVTQAGDGGHRVGRPVPQGREGHRAGAQHGDPAGHQRHRAVDLLRDRRRRARPGRYQRAGPLGPGGGPDRVQLQARPRQPGAGGRSRSSARRSWWRACPAASRARR